jgi:hypothetical protein
MMIYASDYETALQIAGGDLSQNVSRTVIMMVILNGSVCMKLIKRICQTFFEAVSVNLHDGNIKNWHPSKNPEFAISPLCKRFNGSD